MLSRTEKNKKTRNKIQKLEKQEKTRRALVIISKITIVLSIILISLYLYIRYVANNHIMVREYSLEYENLPHSFHGTKIVHFGDLYYDNYNLNLNSLIKTINNLEADIVIFTGGLIKDNYSLLEREEKELITSLKNIKTTIDKFYTIGKTDNEKAIEILNKANFKLLDDTSELVYFKGNNPILIHGIHQKTDINYDSNKNLFKINIVHQPDKTDAILKYNNPELILAGNSLNGQIIIPYVGALVKVEGSMKYFDKYYNLNGTDLFITGGIGTNNYPVRLFNHPSVNLYRLKKK